MTSIVEFRGVDLLATTGARGARPRSVLRQATLAVPPGHYALVGDDADKRAVIDALVGLREARAGRIAIGGRCSYPIGRLSPFSLTVTGSDIVWFFSRLYGFDANEAIARLEELLPAPKILAARLDRAQPVERLSLSVGLGVLLDVEILLVDGSIIDPQFPAEFVKFVAESLADHKARGSIIVSSRQRGVANVLAQDSLVLRNRSIYHVAGIVEPGFGSATSPEEELRFELNEVDEGPVL